jgi:uncharacterized protein
MLTVISPAKTLDYQTPVLTEDFTQPSQLGQSRKLIRQLRQCSAPELASLMNVSSNIAELNKSRFKHWKTPFRLDNARQALFAFKGDVYLGLDAFSMREEDVTFAQGHLRILSGLYGVLRPLDLMQPYRLEMGTRLATEQARNLYQFWDTRITKLLNQELKRSQSDTLVNLASTEYFKSVKTKLLKARIVTPVFKDFNNDEYQVIGFFAKKARGMMSRYIIDQQINDVEALKSFTTAGYGFNAKLSTENEWVFTRKQ